MRRFVPFLVALALVPSPALAQSDAPKAEIRASEARFEAGAFLGVRSWKTAYRKSTSLFTYGAFGVWNPTSWLGTVASVEHARRGSTGELQIRNTETLFAIGPRLGLWFQFLHLFLDLQGTGVIRTVRYRDVDDVSNTRFSAGVSVGPGFTIAAGERLGVTLRLNWRRRDDQSHLLGTLDVSWLFQ